MAFVTKTKEEFQAMLPDSATEVRIPGCKEIVWDIPSGVENLALRVYSTVDRLGHTRGKGEDAIRILLMDTLNNRPIKGKVARVHRTEEKTSIEERIKSRIEELKVLTKDVVIKPLPKKDIWKILDSNYVRAILEHSLMKRNNFAQSLLSNLDRYKSLTDGQLAYVLSDSGKNPKFRPTFEAEIKEKDPDFINGFMNREGSEEVEVDEEIGEDTPAKEREFVRAEPTDPNTVKLFPTKDYVDWKYPFEFFNPVQSMVMDIRENDNNVIIGANTSAGKTIAAETIMDIVLKEGKRCIYASPLKSLTEEKKSAWEKRFPNEKLTILTGDYNLSDEKKSQLADSKLIVLTSEMLDSRTRKMQSEKNFWLMDVGLVIVDESHILSTERGHAVETGIMRFTALNPKARIVFLSATMPNVPELGVWLTKLNGKNTDVIFMDWRPVELQMSYLEYENAINGRGKMDYATTQEMKMQMAVDTVMEKPDEKYLLFVQDKGTGRKIVKKLAFLGQEALFHNADLALSDRLETENSFRDRKGGVRVLVSTSTLAWGVSLPARNVVICGISRGLNPVDELDIIQSAGRAGRFGIDDAGFVFLIIPQGTTSYWKNVFKNPRPVLSVLNQHAILAFHTLAEISVKEIRYPQDFMKWFKRSLAYLQDQSFTEVDANSLIKDLLRMKMIRQGADGVSLTVTNLGRVSSSMYFSPYDVYSWHSHWTMLFNQTGEEKVPIDDYTLAFCIANIPTNTWAYIPKECAAECEDLRWKIGNRGLPDPGNAAPFVLAAYKLLSGQDIDGSVAAQAKTVKYDIQRQVQAFRMIDGMYDHFDQDALWDILPERIRYGIPAELCQLTKIPGIGSQKAKKMWESGIHTLHDIVREKAKMEILFSPAQAKRIISAAERRIVN